MESRKELAAEKKRCGSHNCTQSVLCTYCDLTGLDEDTIKHAGNCFAAGMGNGEGTCGSIVGAGIVYGPGRERPGQGREGHETDHGEVSGAQRCHPLQVAQGRGHGCRAARMSDVRLRRIRVFGGVAGEGGVSLRQRWGALLPHSIGLSSPSSFPVGLCHNQQPQQAIGAAS